jgi:hypothetical protein
MTDPENTGNLSHNVLPLCWHATARDEGPSTPNRRQRDEPAAAHDEGEEPPAPTKNREALH